MSSQNGDFEDRNEAASEAGLSERRAQLNRKLDDRRVEEEKAARKSQSNSSGYAQAMKLSSEFIAGVLVGAGIGWVADQWFGTSPLGLIVFLLLGFAAGVLNVLRSAGVVEQPGETRPGETTVQKDKPEQN
ncbi:MAG: AtpZ/AtpI family protein [Roseibium sp.]|uniref:AtpZ/AtpI family protein n=1 Tax=Roseibium sp. TaxID=1936156 RepID=UPI001B0C59A3|nr:AtpZ/AtpI family protein [Roseibium sp.]MBO6508592.1 AtpZ/AtpI family protein [Roseibium sp.]MBO6890674.1 AtpZ/AtpI family protein [Roseibium sp.]MBO6931466.1 AtpZ/AtpI family protein [Roseibium sp.]